MADEPVDNLNPGLIGGFRRWLKGPVKPSGTSDVAPGADAEDRLPSRIGHYAIRRKLGAGGMGVVYEAEDERLKRPVAVKMMLAVQHDETARKRFWREARAAASINHPHVCQIYEVGEDAGTLFIAMELLDGEALCELLKRGPLSVDQAVPAALDILDALGAIHAGGVIHRDLKPSNVFLARHGIKLLDFGLARPEVTMAVDSVTALTHAGAVLGTPGYMAPEMITGDAVDARTDLFAVGAILFEMLAGRPAFTGRTITALLNATLTEQPPALAGSAEVAAVDRVIRRALAKKPDARPASAAAMADDLKALRSLDGHGVRSMARALTRVVVLPFRVPRSDPDTDFLAFGLADAITTSLAASGSLIVRSSATAARFAGDAPDLKALAVDADVDRVVMGTLMRAGDQLRTTTQLVEAPEGTLLSSHTVQAPLGDLFQMQDDIARRVVEGLGLPLAGERASASPDVPHDPRAYELYLRASGLARHYNSIVDARAIYEQCLELDPTFAPAWAHLGRCHRVIGKLIDPAPDSDSRAEEAFKRAIELNPRLSIAHKFYANLEAEKGRARDAIVRLLKEAARRGNDAELFTGLVHACRYGGLFEQSFAAHEEAQRLDPTARTSFLQTLLLNGELDRFVTLDAIEQAKLRGANEGIRVIGLGLTGHIDEARAALAEMELSIGNTTFRVWGSYLGAWLDRSADTLIANLASFPALKIYEDPEPVFLVGSLLCDLGAHAHGLGYLQRAVAGGYFVAATLEKWPQFDALRSDPAFQQLITAANVGRQLALDAFRNAGGDRLLGR